MSMELIPGLTDDLARECLIRVPFRSFASLLSVSKAWNREIRNPDFHRCRKLAGLTRPVFIITQLDRATSTEYIVLFDPEPGVWSQLPPRPRLPSESVPSVVGVGVNKILTISCRYESSGKGLRYFNMVHVFDFITGQWRRAADMPGPGRFSFGLASDPTRGKVVVAGGFAPETRAMRSVLMYDVGMDEWVRVDDMAKERYVFNAVFHGGKFHVMGGLNPHFPEFPHNFMTCAECLDPETWQWGPVEEGFLEAGWQSGHYRVVENGMGDLYYMGRNVSLRRGGDGEWEVAAIETPDEVRVRSWAMTWQDKLVMIGAKEVNWPSKAYVFDLKSRVWTRNIYVPDEYMRDCVVLGCGMEL